VVGWSRKKPSRAQSVLVKMDNPKICIPPTYGHASAPLAREASAPFFTAQTGMYANLKSP
jgi:hypothetical protein